MPSVPATVTNITNFYLYGTSEKPEHFKDRLRDIPQEQTFNVTAGTDDYMATIGRYAYASNAEIVKAFFEGRISNEGAAMDAQGRLTLSVADYIASVGSDASTKFVISQYVTDPLSSDFKERAYIWGTTAFVIDPSSVFVWHDGTCYIENLLIRPANAEPDENFDFQSSNPAIQFINNTILKPAIDPYGIGRTLAIEFDSSNAPVVSAYTSQNYADDVQDAIGFTTPFDLTGMGAAAHELVADLIAADCIDYFFDDKLIVYGSYGNDTVSVASALPPLIIGDISDYGLAIATGAGMDSITGSEHDDLIYAGRDEDYVYGGAGSDTIHGGAGGDNLDGGVDHDTASFDDAEEGIVFIRAGDTMLGGGSTTSDSYGDILRGFETIIGSEFADQLELLDSGMDAYGGGGADIIKGGAGKDTILGDDGTDILVGAGNDDLLGGGDSDFIRSSNNTAAQVQGWILGDDGHDAIVIAGSTSDVQIAAQGGGENDYILVGANIQLNYNFYLGSGNDHIVLEDEARLNSLNVFNSSQDEWIFKFYLNGDREKVGEYNDATFFMYDAGCTLVAENQATFDSIAVENFYVSIATYRDFTDFEHITMDDIYWYELSTPLEFDEVPAEDLSGFRNSWESWSASADAFSIFGSDVPSVYTRALDDFNNARSESPPISAELWLV